MWTEKAVLAIRREVVEIVNGYFKQEQVDKVLLIGSYATGDQTEESDLDFLVQLKGGRLYPTWDEIQEVKKLLPDGVHVIYGTELAQKSLGKPYRRL